MDYDLDRLGPTEFEHLVQALAIAELGISVTTFGAGRDSGREATFDGRVVSPRDPDLELWNGYGIVQAKTIRFTADTAKNTTSVLKTLKEELDQFVAPPGKQADRTPKPLYYVVATNARLSPVAEVGGVDQVAELLRNHPVGLLGHSIWHYEHICRLLDRHDGIRKTYAGFITPGDILSRLAEMLDGSTAQLGTVLKAHAASQIAAREDLKLETTEFSGVGKLDLSEIAIDLPALTSNQDQTLVVSHILAAGNMSLRSSLRGNKPYGFVIVGGPGQGKSTLGQIVCQAYRVGLLGDLKASISPKIDKAIAGTRARLKELKINVPDNRRWPVFIDLSVFADALAEKPSMTVVEFIALQLRNQGASATAGQVAAWLAGWPWALVLDGLDEVPARDSRNAIVKALMDLIIQSRLEDWDVLIVCTTRPQGYEGEFGELNPEQLELRDLTTAEGLDFGRRIVNGKFDADPEKTSRVIARLERAAKQPHSSRLMRTPLQVTIMEYLLEEMTEVPSTRYELFDGYFRAIYSREAGKAGHLGKLLKLHAEQVEWVHEKVATRLQVKSEAYGDASASIPDREINRLFAQRLADQEYPEAEIDRLALELEKATRQRLVLLVARTKDQMTFEVKSLQEYMAARGIASGPLDQVFARLEALAPSAYWRNTVLLALSRLYTSRPHERDALLERIRQLDTNTELGGFIGYGARLAIDLLEDDFAQSNPAHRKSLLALALSQLGRWAGPELKKLSLLARTAVNGPDKNARSLVVDSLESAFMSNGRARVGAARILRDWEKDPGSSGVLARRLIQADPSWQPSKDRLSTRTRRKLGLILKASIEQKAALNETEFTWDEISQVLNAYVMPDDVTPAESVAISKQEVGQISDRLVAMLGDARVQAELIGVANATPITSAPAAIYLRRLIVAVDQSKPRGHLSVVEASETELWAD